MYGLPEPPLIGDGGQENLVASVSITLEPPEGSGGPFIAVSYEISLRVFCIALALSRLEKKAEPKSKTSNNSNENIKKEDRPENKREAADDNVDCSKKCDDSTDSEQSSDYSAPKQGE